MFAGEVPPQGFQALTRRRNEITEPGCIVQLNQLPAGDLGKLRWQPLRDASLLENQCRERAAKASDHRPYVSCRDTKCKSLWVSGSGDDLPILAALKGLHRA